MTVLAAGGVVYRLPGLVPPTGAGVTGGEWHGTIPELDTPRRAVLYPASTTTLYEASYSERSADIPLEVEMALIFVSLAGITVPEPAPVREYLREHPDMLVLLRAICAAVRESFEPGTEFSLEVYSDPEIDDKYLTLYVRQQHYGPDILDRIERVSSDYDAELSEKTGWLLITTDFQPPR